MNNTDVISRMHKAEHEAEIAKMDRSDALVQLAQALGREHATRDKLDAAIALIADFVEALHHAKGQAILAGTPWNERDGYLAARAEIDALAMFPEHVLIYPHRHNNLDRATSLVLRLTGERDAALDIIKRNEYKEDSI